MKNEPETKPAASDPVFVLSMLDLDEETIELLVDDMIATGG